MTFAFKASNSEQLLRVYGREAFVNASRNALNDTSKKTRTEISRQVRRVFNINAGKVKEKSRLVRYSGNHQNIDIRYSDHRPNLGRFGTGSSKNIRVKVKRGRGSKKVYGGFRIRGRGADHLIWKRLSPSEAKSTQYRARNVKIKVLRTIAVPEMVRSASNLPAIQSQIQSDYDARFDHHFRRQIGLRR